MRAAINFYHPRTGAVIDWGLTQVERLSRAQLWAVILVGLALFWAVVVRWVLS